MRNMSALRIILVCIALVFSIVRLAVREHWPINIFEVVVGFATLVTIALAIRRKQQASQTTEAATPGKVQVKKPTKLALVYVLSSSILFAYMGGQLLHTVMHSRQLAQEEQRWPMTNATIVGNALRATQHKNQGQTWSPVWAYTYSVDGRTYQSQSMALAGGFNAHWYPNRDDAMVNARSRPDGSVVAVYYDRANPSRSVLDRRTIDNGNADGVVLMLSVVLMMVPVGALALIYASWKKRKRVGQ